MSERKGGIEQQIKQEQERSPVTKAARIGNWLSVFTMAGAIIFAAPVALGVDILGNVAGAEIKERNDKRIANKFRGRERLNPGSRMAKIEENSTPSTSLAKAA